MAKIGCNPSISATITLELSEAEAAALDALVGYGVEPFLAAFYEKMGRSYLEPYEKGLRSLFESIRGGDASVATFLTRAKEAREIFHRKKPK